jgi:predicted nucleic acid-binding protein
MKSTGPVILDSSAWISHFTGHSTSAKIEPYVSRSHTLLVPTVVIYEVYRQLYRKLGPKEAISILGPMQEADVVAFDGELALLAAEMSVQHRLGTADAAIYATAEWYKAELVTLDNDFRGLPRCIVIGATPSI